MFIKMRVLILIYVFSVTCFKSEATITDVLVPDANEAARNFLTVISKSSVVVNLTESIYRALGNILRNIFKIPSEVSRRLGFGLANGVPFVNEYNSIDLINRFVPDLTQTTDHSDEEAYLNFVELFGKYGFTVETHHVIAEDGYNLTMYRVPGKGPVVFCQHGLFESADDYITGGRYTGHGYLLADDDYDVWFGNSRGNKYSRSHISLDPSRADFWNFTWHEIGIYDLPAMIDYVLNATSSSTLKYIGHSEGTTAFFVMTSVKPEYNKKISVMAAFSPIAYLSHTTSVLAIPLFSVGPILHLAAKVLGVYEILADTNSLRSLKYLIENLGAVGDFVLANVLYLLVGPGYAQTNFSTVPVVAGHFPSGSSIKEFVHYSQSYLTGEFRQFDYGIEGNIEMYGSETPPEYPLEKITVPIALFTSDNDVFAQPADVGILQNKLQKVVLQKHFKHYNHEDFLYGMNIATQVYPVLKEFFEKY